MYLLVILHLAMSILNFIRAAVFFFHLCQGRALSPTTSRLVTGLLGRRTVFRMLGAPFAFSLTFGNSERGSGGHCRVLTLRKLNRMLNHIRIQTNLSVDGKNKASSSLSKMNEMENDGGRGGRTAGALQKSCSCLSHGCRSE